MDEGTETGPADIDEVVAESWQMFANCLGVDPDLFFPERGASTKEAKPSARDASFARTASSTRCPTARSSASGVGSASGSVGASVASVPWLEPRAVPHRLSGGTRSGGDPPRLEQRTTARAAGQTRSSRVGDDDVDRMSHGRGSIESTTRSRTSARSGPSTALGRPAPGRSSRRRTRCGCPRGRPPRTGPPRRRARRPPTCSVGRRAPACRTGRAATVVAVHARTTSSGRSDDWQERPPSPPRRTGARRQVDLAVGGANSATFGRRHRRRGAELRQGRRSRSMMRSSRPPDRLGRSLAAGAEVAIAARCNGVAEAIARMRSCPDIMSGHRR